jgi:hypothetical protein
MPDGPDVISKHQMRALKYQLRNVQNLTLEQAQEMLRNQAGVDILHLLRYDSSPEARPSKLSKQLPKQMVRRKLLERQG